MSQEPTITSSDVLSIFQPTAAIDYIRNVNKQRPDADLHVIWTFLEQRLQMPIKPIL